MPKPNVSETAIGQDFAALSLTEDQSSLIDCPYYKIIFNESVNLEQFRRELKAVELPALMNIPKLIELLQDTEPGSKIDYTAIRNQIVNLQSAPRKFQMLNFFTDLWNKHAEYIRIGALHVSHTLHGKMLDAYFGKHKDLRFLQQVPICLMEEWSVYLERAQNYNQYKKINDERLVELTQECDAAMYAIATLKSDPYMDRSLTRLLYALRTKDKEYTAVCEKKVKAIRARETIRKRNHLVKEKARQALKEQNMRNIHQWGLIGRHELSQTMIDAIQTVQDSFQAKHLHDSEQQKETEEGKSTADNLADAMDQMSVSTSSLAAGNEHGFSFSMPSHYTVSSATLTQQG